MPLFERKRNSSGLSGPSSRRSLRYYYRTQQHGQASRERGQGSGLRDAFSRVGRVAIIAMFVLGAVGLLWSMKLNRATVSSRSGANVSLYRGSVEEQLSQSFLGSLKPWFNRDAFRAELMRRHPEIKDVTFKTPLWSRTLEVEIARYEPSLIWQSQGVEFLIGEDGVAYAKRGGESSSAPHASDESNVAVTLGQPAVPTTLLDFIQAFERARSADQEPVVTVKDFTVPPLNREIRLLLADKPYYVKLTIEEDAFVQYADLSAALKHFRQHGGEPSEYIDVRIRGKAAYR